MFVNLVQDWSHDIIQSQIDHLFLSSSWSRPFWNLSWIHKLLWSHVFFIDTTKNGSFWGWGEYCSRGTCPDFLFGCCVDSIESTQIYLFLNKEILVGIFCLKHGTWCFFIGANPTQTEDLWWQLTFSPTSCHRFLMCVVFNETQQPNKIPPTSPSLRTMMTLLFSFKFLIQFLTHGLTR